MVARRPPGSSPVINYEEPDGGGERDSRDSASPAATVASVVSANGSGLIGHHSR